jgi:cytochrome c peroxidase
MRFRVASSIFLLAIAMSCLGLDAPNSVAHAAAPAVASGAPVLLGSPELTAGIPGDGPLTPKKVQAWLADPKNHEVLQIELPLGLNAGIDQVKGLEANPLTRAKIELGRQLYFDVRLAKDTAIACAGCHDPAQGYATHTQFGIGIEKLTGNRNSPTAYNRILSDVQFWDGRAASLEEQAKGPIANPIEMGNTHDACVTCLDAIPGYKLQFAKIFPDEGLTIDTVAKAIASFERAIVTGPSPYDYNEQLRLFADQDIESLKEDDPDAFALYEKAVADAKAHPMNDSAKRGRDLFFGQKANCTACHVGPNLADEKYHNLGVGMAAEKPDLGRFEVTKVEADKGAFKTPTIRNVEQTAPYMHDGSQQTLEEVVEWYNKGGHPNPYLDKDVRKLDLTDQEKADLVAFMKACTGPLPKVETERLPQ